MKNRISLLLFLKGADKAKLFGEKTMGLTTTNDQYDLLDGSILFLSVSYFADRNGVMYKTGIEPDFKYENGEKQKYPWEGPFTNIAIDWLDYSK